MIAAIWVTTECNMMCKYCYEGDVKSNRGMSLSTSNKVIEYILKHVEKTNDETLIVNFHGGEPLIQFGIIKHICEEFKSKLKGSSIKLSFGITTNGILMNDEIIQYLSDGFSYSLSVSIDGSQETHDKNRLLVNGQGSYSKVIDNFLKLLRYCSDVRARMTFTPETVNALYDNVKFLVDLGFKTIVPVPDYFNNSWNMNSMQILYSQLEKIARLLVDERKTNTNLRVGIIEEMSIKKKNDICRAGYNTVNIDPDGNIYPCTYTVGNEEYLIGNVRDGINESKLHEIIELSSIENKECIGCSRYNYCSATRCKLINNVMTGDYHKPSAVLCSVENIKHNAYKYYEELL